LVVIEIMQNVYYTSTPHQQFVDEGKVMSERALIILMRREITLVLVLVFIKHA
jgi:hypothetical protein